jgi:septum site-determining protein MinD
MTRIISCLAGKGGVGKTFITANLGVALAEFGKDVIAIDSNLTTPNLGLHLGVPLYPVTIQDVMRSRAKLHEATYMHPSGLRVIPAGIGINDLRGVDPKNLAHVILDLLGSSEFVLLDVAAGLGKEALSALEASDESIFVTNPNLPSVIDALKAVKLAEQLGSKPIGVVVNRVQGHKYEMTREDIMSMLNLPIIAEVPEDRAVPESIARRMPVLHHKPHSSASRELRALAASMIGYKLQTPWHHKVFSFLR